MKLYKKINIRAGKLTEYGTFDYSSGQEAKKKLKKIVTGKKYNCILKKQKKTNGN